MDNNSVKRSTSPRKRPFLAQVQEDKILSSPEIRRLSNMQMRLPMGVAIFAIFVAILVLWISPRMEQGTGILVAALLAGAGWAFTRTIEESRVRINIASGYISAIDRLRREMEGHLHDEELERYRILAPAIRDNLDKPAWRAARHRILDDLPELRDHRHLLLPETVEALTAWSIMHVEVSDFYDMLGTNEMMQISQQRLEDYFDYMRLYRDEYFRICIETRLRLHREIARHPLWSVVQSRTFRRAVWMSSRAGRRWR